MKKLSLFLITWLCISSVQGAQQQAVAAPDKYSAQVANDILLAGGNAVDAAIAVQFVLAVTLPEAGNIGGGGFMLIYKDKEAEFIDYRETAPLKAHRDMYLDENGNVIPNISIFGIKAAGVPGTVSGMWQAYQKHGSLPWKDLVQPAVDLAQNGFIVHPQLAEFIAEHNEEIKTRYPDLNFADYFAHAKANEVFVQPELAETLKRIRDKGRDGFYAGETADIIVEFMQREGGLISHEDLLIYKAKWRKPIQAKWREYELLTAPPPSSGGIAIVQWLSLYDMVKPTQLALRHNSADYMHLLAESGKRVFADRAAYLGDPDFFDVPIDALINQDYLLARAQDISLSHISNSHDINPGLKESEQTTHFSIMDKWGNAVSNTTTINLGFGNSVVVEGAGFLLNNEMDDFSAKPGVSNYFGAIGGKANEIQPQKRMLSSMTPTIVLSGDEVKIVTGSPGGTTIITSVYQSILNIIDHGMTAQEATDAPRFHHQLWPENQIRYHKGIDKDVVSALSKMGYELKQRHFGDLHMIVNGKGGLEAGSEKNGRGLSIVTEGKGH